MRRRITHQGFTSRVGLSSLKPKRTIKTYQDVAIDNLRKHLKDKLDITDINKSEKILLRYNNLYHLNMEVMATMLIFIHQNMPSKEVLQDEASTQSYVQQYFTYDNLIPYIQTQQLPTTDQETAALRMMANLIRYFTLYSSYAYLEDDEPSYAYEQFEEEEQ